MGPTNKTWKVCLTSSNRIAGKKNLTEKYNGAKASVHRFSQQVVLKMKDYCRSPFFLIKRKIKKIRLRYSLEIRLYDGFIRKYEYLFFMVQTVKVGVTIFKITKKIFEILFSVK